MANSPAKLQGNRKWSIAHYHKLRRQIYLHYGGPHPRCACCGEDNEWFLTLDHINNDGYRHRRSLGKKAGTVQLYISIIKNNYPSTMQILCMNCNFGKKLRKGTCPHVAYLTDLPSRF